MINPLKADKKILLHIGPPKTGSSAIQKCFLDNQQKLLELGFFYPSHTTDKNGISSGHQHVILSQNESGEYVIDRSKINRLIDEFNESNANVLILSSEAFFRRANTLIRILPQCEAIAFVRNPIDFIESIYNQSVKRHRNSEIMKFPAHISTRQLEILTEFIEGNKTKNILLYAYLSGQDIVDVFEKALGLTHRLARPEKPINSSYSHEALQFKRILNAFEVESGLDNDIDMALQGYSQDSRDYSYIPPEIYKQYKEECLEALSSFCQVYSVHDEHQLFNELTEGVYAPVRSQSIEADDLVGIVSYLREAQFDKYLVLKTQLLSQQPRNQEMQMLKAALFKHNFRDKLKRYARYLRRLLS